MAMKKSSCGILAMSLERFQMPFTLHHLPLQLVRHSQNATKSWCPLVPLRLTPLTQPADRYTSTSVLEVGPSLPHLAVLLPYGL